MKPRLFHTLVFMGASLTGTVGVVVVPAALGLTGCNSSPGAFGFIDMSFVDLGVFGFIDMSAPIFIDASIPPDLAMTDGSDPDAGSQ